MAIGIAGTDDGDLAALNEWLGNENELRGRVQVVNDPIGDTALGPLSDSLTVALSAGGAGTVLASSLITLWSR